MELFVDALLDASLTWTMSLIRFIRLGFPAQGTRPLIVQSGRYSIVNEHPSS